VNEYEDLHKFLVNKPYNFTGNVGPEKAIYTKQQRIEDPGDKMKSLDIDITITVIAPGKNAKKEFVDLLSKSDVFAYSGHARKGLGPYIGAHKYLAKENVRIKNRLIGKTDLEKMSAGGKFDPDKYQLWFFNACSSVRYLDEISEDVADVAGNPKSDENLDVIFSNAPVFGDARAFLGAVLEFKDINKVLAEVNKAEAGTSKPGPFSVK
jgi:hypothetical protein